jgi:hypothetical protein
MFILPSKNDEMTFIPLTLSLFSMARLIFFFKFIIKHCNVIKFLFFFLNFYCTKVNVLDIEIKKKIYENKNT